MFKKIQKKLNQEFESKKRKKNRDIKTGTYSFGSVSVFEKKSGFGSVTVFSKSETSVTVRFRFA